jgi:hypothetical protein
MKWGFVIYCASGYQMKEYELGGPCSTYCVERKCLKMLMGKPEGKNYWEDLDLDEVIILK